MGKKICLFLYAFSLFFKIFGGDATEYSIVFVHIGPSLPDYTITAIKQSRLFNPKADIYLVAQSEAYQKLCLTQDVATYRPIFVSAESLPLSSEHAKFRKKSKLDNVYRNGFWRYATERFFYLSALMSCRGLKNVFHMENDVMLYRNLEELLGVFCDRYKGIAATFDNENRVIPGFLYISDAQSIGSLTKFLAKRSHRGENDMVTLASFKSVENGKYMDNLPIIFPNYVEKFPFMSAAQHRTDHPYKFFNNYDRFHSIFDAAAIGQYLGGVDPRNGNIPAGFINESCLFNPSFFEFAWQMDPYGRKVPYALFEGQKIRINNLHIHCKNLDAFFSGNL
jgi:hypothetical protein